MSLKITRPTTKNFDKPFTTDHTYEFQRFLNDNGLEPEPKKGLVTDGSIGRAYINVGGQRKLVGWYQLWIDQSVPFGRLGDYRISADQPTAIWKPEHQKKMKITKEQKEEIAQLQKEAEGVWTIGYGHTKNVQEGQVIKQEEAESMLLHELLEYCEHVEKAVKVDLTQNQFDALVSWTYNLGPSNLNRSTLLKVVNVNNMGEVPTQIKRWNKAGGKVLDGLVRRRKAEALMFEGKDWTEV